MKSNPFFSQHYADSFKEPVYTDGKDNNALPLWIISADKIFASEITGFKEYSKFFGLEFSVSRFSLFDGTKTSDSAVAAHDVKIYMPSGRHCAMIQGRMAKGVIISKITLKKILLLSAKIEEVESKEFSQCVIQSFERKGEIVAFSFRYASYSDSYTDFKEDGSKLGTAATKIDLTTWKTEDS